MVAKKCDRCGILYEQYNIQNNKQKINGLNTLNIDCKQQYYSHGPLDLCPKCSEILSTWLKGDK